MNIQVKKMVPHAKLPVYAHPSDAGADLFCCENVSIYGGSIVQIRTGVAVQIPEGHVGLMWDKSGLAANMGLKIMGGVIDAGYTGELVVTLLNTTPNVYNFARGSKITQLLVQRVEQANWELVEDLPMSPRGGSGFGSTGA